MVGSPRPYLNRSSFTQSSTPWLSAAFRVTISSKLENLTKLCGQKSPVATGRSICKNTFNVKTFELTETRYSTHNLIGEIYCEAQSNSIYDTPIQCLHQGCCKVWVAGSHLGWLEVSRNSPSCKYVWYRIRTWIQARQARCSEIPTFSNFGHHILEIVDFLSVQPLQKELQKLPNTLFLLTGRKILK